jgi:hypothetical protein
VGTIIVIVLVVTNRDAPTSCLNELLTYVFLSSPQGGLGEFQEIQGAARKRPEGPGRSEKKTRSVPLAE